MNAGTGTFADALEHHWKAIFHLGLRMFGDPTEAEEAAQQTFFLAYQHWDQFEGRSEIQTWLFRIAINVCRKRLRERNRFQGYELDPEKLTASGELDRSADDLHGLVRMAFESLEPRDRLILTLFCIEELRHAGDCRHSGRARGDRLVTFTSRQETPGTKNRNTSER